MDMLTIAILIGCTFAAAAVNAEVQRRLLAKGGRWLPSTIKSGLSGFAVMIGTIGAYLAICAIVTRAAS